MSVTIYDIAAKANVSIATVSRVFNNHPRVADGTRAKVLAIADEVGYEPHVSAQSLARRRTHLISAVTPVLTNYFYMEILRGMQDALVESEFDLIVYTASQPEEINGQLQRAVQRGRADGLILLSTPPTTAHIRRLKAAKFPVVLLDAVHAAFDAIGVDNVQGGYLATTYLIERGYERVAHISVRPESPPAIQRRQGYERALREASRAVNPDLIVASNHSPYGFTEEAGYEAMRVLLHLSPRPDAVFVASDVQALGAMQAARDAGLDVPGDIALIGFDDVEISKHVGLSTLRQPMHEMGRLAVERLLQRIKQPEAQVSQTVFSPCLITRTTCGGQRGEA